MNPIRGVIFDLDGTLIDSPLDFSAIRAEIGCDKRLVLEYLESLVGEARRRGFEILHRHESHAAANAALRPGARELFEHLERAGLKKE